MESDRQTFRVWVLAGPTASGKTALAHGIAARINARILSADSMLVYRGMDVGTAKPTAGERQRFRYAGVDFLDPSEQSSAGAYRAHALNALKSDPDTPWILVGGTGLYIRALLSGLDDPGEPPKEIRDEVREMERTGGLEALQRWLQAHAPEEWRALADRQNPRRLQRAIERARAGVPVPRSWSDSPAAPPGMVVLHPDRDWLADRIRRRAGAMFETGGLEDETRRLMALYPGFSETARHAIGYAEAMAVLGGSMTRSEAVERTALRTRQYARRQAIWFRRQAGAAGVEIGPGVSMEEASDRILQQWSLHGPVAIRT